MENRAVLAFIISMVLITLWMFWFTPQQPPPPEIEEQPTVERTEEVAEAEGPSSTEQPIVSLEKEVPDFIEKTVLVDTPLYEAKFSSRGATLLSWKLKNYKNSLAEEAPLIDLVSLSSGKSMPLNLRMNGRLDEAINSANFTFDPQTVYLKSPNDRSTLKGSSSFSNGLSVSKEFTFYGDRYDVDLSVSICDANGMPVNHQMGLVWPHSIDEKSSRWAGFSGPVVFSGEKVRKVKDIDEYPSEGSEIQWAGYTLKYFLTAIVPLGTARKSLHLSKDDSTVSMVVAQDLDNPQRCEYHYKLFLGPKKISELRKSEHHLDKSIHFGLFDFIARPLLIMVMAVNKYTHNYGIAIIILTILIKLVTWPLTHKSYASMKEMQKIQPRMQQIRERFKHDKEQLNREMMLLYKTHKVNPLGGCLPLLLQFPIFIALYRALLDSIELRHAPFILWVKDLAAPDYLLNFPAGVSIFGIEGIGPLPLLMGASMLIQQKMTPSVGDPTQAKIMMLMPIFFTFIFIGFPSGLVLYWLTNNVLSIVQQVYINSRLQ